VRKVEGMDNPIRMTAAKEGEIDAPAGEVWELLTDFAGILRWWPQDDSSPIGIERVTLIGKHGNVPRSREILVAGGTATEELYLEDEKALRIYYDMKDGGIPNVFNYLATTTIDRLPENRSLMSFSSHYDIPADADVVFYRQRVEAVYDSIMDGFRRFFATPADGRPPPSYL
jgi:uncharacterized protein YndB with AHSA1/START domain